MNDPLPKVNLTGTDAEKVDDVPTHAERLKFAVLIAEAATNENWWFIAMARTDGTQQVWSMKKPTSKRAKLHLADQMLAIYGLMRVGRLVKFPRWVRWGLSR